MSLIITYPTHSLARIFPQGEVPPHSDSFTALRNEPLSFQIGYTVEEAPNATFYLRIQSDLPISLYDEGCVPLITTANAVLTEQYAPGTFPDLLLPRPVNPPLEPIHNAYRRATNTVSEQSGRIPQIAYRGTIRALWLTVNEDGKRLAAGDYPITVEFYNVRSELIGSCTVTVRLLAATLPHQTLCYTNWFHCDCLADTYGVELWSEEFYRVFRHQVTAAARHGMNMLLTPTFTPALDTRVDTERMTAQLVDVTLTDGVYSFGFDKLKRYIDEARSCGIRYFELAWLFTQWGARYAPKVMATVNGKYRHLFGWHTDANSKKYMAFLQAYLPALRDFLRTEGLEKRVLFHISDEPDASNIEQYRRASDMVRELIGDCMLGDALSHYEIYEQGLLNRPIVMTTHAHDFVGRAKHLWCYYTGGELQEGASNRLIINTTERNRMLGVQMYMCRMEGFLHWAYNFYYGTMSQGLFNPLTEPHANGSTYMVYPNTDGTAIPSVRMKTFYEAINDMRALQRLERLRGRRFTEALVREHYGDVTMLTHPESADKLLALRAAVNDAIAAAI